LLALFILNLSIGRKSLKEKKMEALAEFYLNRMDTAYQEQTWAVALIGSLNLFVASHSVMMLACFRKWLLQTALFLASSGALAIVWSRHCIYMYYDGCLKTLLAGTSVSTVCSDGSVFPITQNLALYSGVSFYLLIIVCMYVFAARMIAVTKHPDIQT